MSLTNAPFGFKPAYPTGGFIRPTTLGGPGAPGIDPAYATAIPEFAPVVLTTAGVLNIATTSGAIAGIFVGATWRLPNSLPNSPIGFIKSKFWPTGGVPGATEVTAYLYTPAQGVEFEVQASGAYAATGIYDQVNCINPGTVIGSGFSGAGVNATPVGAGNTGQFVVIGIAPDATRALNTAGDAFTKLIVKINQSQSGPASVVAV